MALLEKDYRKRPCPQCKTTGTIRLDPASSTFRCTKCGVSNIDPFKDDTEQPPTKKTPRPDQPHVPPSAQSYEIVREFVSRKKHDGTVERAEVRRMYCPKKTGVNVLEFDPNSPHVQWVLGYYDKRIKNRRRYNRDIAKREEKRKERNELGTELFD